MKNFLDIHWNIKLEADNDNDIDFKQNFNQLATILVVW